MLPHEAAALAAIRTIYAEPIRYTGAGLDDAEISAVPTFEEAPGEYAVQRRCFEVAEALFPSTPTKGNRLRHDDSEWRVVEARRDAEVGAWRVFVEVA